MLPLELLLDRLEFLFANDRRHGDGDPLARRLRPARPAVRAVEVVLAGVGGPRQDAMQVLAAEARFAVAEPAVIEVADAALDAERAVSGTLAVEAEDQAHDLRFRRIDLDRKSTRLNSSH